MNSIQQKIRLNNGYMVPVVSACPDLQNATDAPTWLEDWQKEHPAEEPFRKEIEYLLSLGCRSFDTGYRYGTEQIIGKIFQTCGIPRNELYITTKIYHQMQGYDNTMRAIDDILKRTRLDYIDVLLIHCPIVCRGLYRDTWLAMNQAYRQGIIKAIGVSNFNVQQFYDLFAVSDIIPAVNQREQHPFYVQPNLTAFEHHYGILTQSYSPLGHGRYANDNRLKWIADIHGKSVAQIILRWHVQSGYMLVTRSANFSRMKENMEIFDFSLSSKEMSFIDSLNHGTRIWHDPMRFPGSCYYYPVEQAFIHNIESEISKLRVSEEIQEKITAKANELIESKDIDGTSDYVIYCFKRAVARYGANSEIPVQAEEETKAVAKEMIERLAGIVEKSLS